MSLANLLCGMFSDSTVHIAFVTGRDRLDSGEELANEYARLMACLQGLVFAGLSGPDKDSLWIKIASRLSPADLKNIWAKVFPTLYVHCLIREAS